MWIQHCREFRLIFGKLFRMNRRAYDIDDGTINVLIPPDYTVSRGASDQCTSFATLLFSGQSAFDPVYTGTWGVFPRGRRTKYHRTKRISSLEWWGALDCSDGLCAFSSHIAAVMARAVVTDRILRWADIVWRERGDRVATTLEWKENYWNRHLCQHGISLYATVTRGKKSFKLRLQMLLWHCSIVWFFFELYFAPASVQHSMKFDF